MYMNRVCRAVFYCTGNDVEDNRLVQFVTNIESNVQKKTPVVRKTQVWNKRTSTELDNIEIMFKQENYNYNNNKIYILGKWIVFCVLWLTGSEVDSMIATMSNFQHFYVKVRNKFLDL